MPGECVADSDSTLYDKVTEAMVINGYDYSENVEEHSVGFVVSGGNSEFNMSIDILEGISAITFLGWFENVPVPEGSIPDLLVEVNKANAAVDMGAFYYDEDDGCVTYKYDYPVLSDVEPEFIASLMDSVMCVIDDVGSEILASIGLS